MFILSYSFLDWQHDVVNVVSDRTQSNARNAMTEAEKRERRALERKLSEMEEELKVSIDFVG